MQFYPIKTKNDQIFYVMPRPQGEKIYTEIAEMKTLNIDTVLCLLQDFELPKANLEKAAKVYQEKGIDYLRLPIRDERCPPDFLAAKAMIETLYDKILSGKTIAIHCYGGIGRSGTIAVGVLLHWGYEVLEAVNLVSESRGMEVAKAQEQRQWLYEYAWKLRNAF